MWAGHERGEERIHLPLPEGKRGGLSDLTNERRVS
jgi:hypothetical protein